MAVGTKDLLGCGLVRETLDVLVAIDACKHGAVDGVFELLRVNIERDGLAIDFGSERRIAVAGEAVLVFQFVLGANGEGRAQQKERERTEQDSAGDFHAIEETPVAICAP